MIWDGTRQHDLRGRIMTRDSREKEYYWSMCLFLVFTDFFLWRRFLDTMLVLKHLVQSLFDFTITCPKQFLHSM